MRKEIRSSLERPGLVSLHVRWVACAGKEESAKRCGGDLTTSPPSTFGASGTSKIMSYLLTNLGVSTHFLLPIFTRLAHGQTHRTPLKPWWRHSYTPLPTLPIVSAWKWPLSPKPSQHKTARTPSPATPVKSPSALQSCRERTYKATGTATTSNAASLLSRLWPRKSSLRRSSQTRPRKPLL